MTTLVTPGVRTPLDNFVTNSTMQVNQRGFSTAALGAATPVFTGDRFQVYSDQTGLTVTRDSADLPPVSLVGCRVAAVCKIESTATGTSGENVFSTSIEGADMLSIRDSKWVTLSLAAKFNYTGTFSVGIRNTNNGYSYVKSFTIPDTNYNKYVLTFQVDESVGGTWDWGSNRLISISFGLGNTSATTATEESWIAGNTPYHNANTDIKGAIGRIARIGAIKLEPGILATPLSMPLYYEDLFRAMRHTQINPLVYGHALSATQQYFTWIFKIPMIIAPTASMLTTTPSTEHPPFAVAKPGTGTTIAGAHTGTQGCDLNLTGFTGLTSPNPSMMYQGQVIVEALP